jgi:hypothetical protein
MEYIDIIDIDYRMDDLNKYLYNISKVFNTKEVEIFSKFKDNNQRTCLHIKLHTNVKNAIEKIKVDDFCKNFMFFSDYLLSN